MRNAKFIILTQTKSNQKYEVDYDEITYFFALCVVETKINQQKIRVVLEDLEFIETLSEGCGGIDNLNYKITIFDEDQIKLLQEYLKEAIKYSNYSDLVKRLKIKF